MGVNAIEVEGLSKRYRLGQDHRRRRSVREALTDSFRRRGRERASREEIWSLRDIDLTIAEGDAVGIVGRNGAGKSTLLKIVSRITEPTTGVARTRGRVGSLLEVGTGFHLELTGRENVYLNGAILGMTRREITRRFDEIVAFAAVERFIDTPVKRYSTGMHLRLAFAVAAHLEPDILLVDEVLAVGDAEFQARCLQRMETVEGEGRTVVFVSHNLDAVNRLCRRAVWFEQGLIAAEGRADEVLESYVRAQSQGTGGSWRELVKGPVTVHGVDVEDRDGLRVETFRRNEPIVLVVRYSLSRPVGGIDIAAFVQRASGPEVLCEAWGDTERDRHGDAGAYEARLEIPGVLNVGEYVVGLWIGDPYETYLHEMTVRRFHVTGDAQNRPNRAVALRLPWRVERIDAETRS